MSRNPASANDLPHMALHVGLAALGGALCGWLLWAAASAHLRNACVVRDTPYLPICPSASPQPDEEQLRHRLSRNPGDAKAWIALLTTEPPPAQQELLAAVFKVAPNDADVLRLRTVDALTRNDLPTAVELLVKMTEQGLGQGDPPKVLARLIATPKGAELVRPHLVPGSGWLPSVIQQMSSLKLPPEPVFPLLAEAAAKHIVPQQTVQSFVRTLKAERKWADAYGLWAAQQRQPLSVLFNGSFEQPFQRDGFDWEVTSSPPGRAGAVLSQQTERGHGQVLEIQFNGRALATPVMRQYLFVAPGRYVIHGQYMTAKLRVEEGLAWAVRCTNDGPRALAGQSEALKDTNRIWKSFSFEVDVPDNCGLVASLQLETFASFEAAAGVRGTASFDAFELRQLE